MRAIVAFVALVAVSSVATAGVQFSTYEGPDAVQTGSGGAKIVKDGVDFWTDGTPPRRYQVLGFITDTREDKAFSGHAVGSNGLAKRVKAAGGDALVVVNQDSESSGMFGRISLGGPSWGRAVHKITTKFAVVRYLPDSIAPAGK